MVIDMRLQDHVSNTWEMPMQICRFVLWKILFMRDQEEPFQKQSN